MAGLLTACPPADSGTASEPQTTTSSAATTGTTTTTETGPTTGSTGGESTTGGGEAKRCQSQCDNDRDCRIDGGDLGFRCIDGLCLFPPCTSDAQCLAELSGWKTPCAGPGECAAEEACVLVADAGRCALTPATFACADFGLVEQTLPLFEGRGEATVCGQAAATCEAGACQSPCAGDEACLPQTGHPVCDVPSGACVCQIDQDCLDSGLPGYVQCVAGRCGCAVDSDCAGGQNVDTCYAGACGCSADATCTVAVFDGAPLVCQ
ncbi:hypothetical protein [Nannocystis exedens]|uniref:hypothetical protein n=1 Tax=Nannocystis exedens TaxID=54 RepID=UPI0014745A2D|nr:hypothetical protein [Nannocystis exedens]